MNRRHQTTERRAEQLNVARGLGWFSLALGVTELVAPRLLARWLGMPGSETLLQTYGVREIGTGIGILASNDPAAWVWGRVGGDAVDIATLASGLNNDNPKKGNVGVALAGVLGVTLLDAVCASALSSSNAEQRDRRDVATQAYSKRSGFPAPPARMRGLARDFKVPEDMRTPKLLRPFTLHRA
jgi:hypothetical protein